MRRLGSWRLGSRRLESSQLESRRRSQRFSPSPWSQYLVPALLGLLLLVLFSTLLLVALSIFGLTPGS